MHNIRVITSIPKNRERQKTSKTNDYIKLLYEATAHSFLYLSICNLSSNRGMKSTYQNICLPPELN